MHLVYNEQTGDFEEVLYIDPPKILSFKMANVGDTLFKNDVAHLIWNVIDAEKVLLDGEEIPDQIFSRDITCEKTGLHAFELVAKNSCGDVRRTLNVSVIDKPQFNIQCSKAKLKRGKGETCEIKWEIRFSHEIYLVSPDGKTKIDSVGSTRIAPEETTELTFEALAIDNTSIFKESVTIEVHDEAIVVFDADKLFSYPRIPIVLSWDVQNSLSVELEGYGEQEPMGSKIVEPTKSTTYRLFVTDAFGRTEYKKEVQMFPLPQIKALLLPTPKINSNLSISITQPRYNVSVKFPTINIGLIRSEIPKVPSFTDMNMNVELSPPLPEFSIRRVFKRVKNTITKRIKSWRQTEEI